MPQPPRFLERPKSISFLHILLEVFHAYKTVCVCVCSVAQICLTLCDFMDCSLPGSSVHGIFSARILEWVALHSSRGIFPTLGSNPHFLHYRVLTTEPMGRPYKTIYAYKI